MELILLVSLLVLRLFLPVDVNQVDLFHLDSALLGTKWSEKYAENQRVSHHCFAEESVDALCLD